MPLYRNARECLSAVVERYKGISSYSDTGSVRPFGGKGLASCWFQTQYQAPSFFRYEFAKPHPYRPLRHLITRNVIGSNTEGSYYFVCYPRSEPTLEQRNSVQREISRATGVSQGTAHTIGKLLIPEVTGFSLTDLLRPRFRRFREFEGVRCFSISGIHPRRGRFTVWVGVGDLLLRKLISHSFRHEEVRSNIVLNQPIAKGVFNVPKTET
jgi:hypothetical protein